MAMVGLGVNQAVVVGLSVALEKDLHRVSVDRANESSSSSNNNKCSEPPCLVLMARAGRELWILRISGRILGKGDWVDKVMLSRGVVCWMRIVFLIALQVYKAPLHYGNGTNRGKGGKGSEGKA